MRRCQRLDPGSIPGDRIDIEPGGFDSLQLVKVEGSADAKTSHEHYCKGKLVRNR